MQVLYTRCTMQERNKWVDILKQRKTKPTSSETSGSTSWSREKQAHQPNNTKWGRWKARCTRQEAEERGETLDLPKAEGCAIWHRTTVMHSPRPKASSPQHPVQSNINNMHQLQAAHFHTQILLYHNNAMTNGAVSVTTDTLKVKMCTISSSAHS